MPVMTVQELQWLMGIAITVVLGIGGIAIGAFYKVFGKIDAAVDNMHTLVKQGDDALHERVNRLKDDTNNNYVRRADLDSYMKRLDDTLKEMRDDIKQIVRDKAKPG